jgi:hypothetical protein
MNDDWRVQVDFVEEGLADAVYDKLEARELEHDLSRAFHDRVIVSRNDTTIFLYAGDREQAEKARALVDRLAAEDEEEIEVSFTRWHPEAEEWRPADEPLPEDAAARAAEHAARTARERQESQASGHPEYEVSAHLTSFREAERFAEQLRSEGLPTVHRWKYLLVGATDEDSANQLAERIRNEVAPGTKVVAEGTWREAYEEWPHPFAALGGIAN